MKEKLTDRIRVLIDYYGLSKNAFDASITKANGYIGKQIKKRASIGSDTVETILHVYKQISPAWLINGEGEMLRNDITKGEVKEPASEYGQDSFEQILLQYLDRPKIKEKLKNLLKDG